MREKQVNKIHHNKKEKSKGKRIKEEKDNK